MRFSLLNHGKYELLQLLVLSYCDRHRAWPGEAEGSSHSSSRKPCPLLSIRPWKLAVALGLSLGPYFPSEDNSCSPTPPSSYCFDHYSIEGTTGSKVWKPLGRVVGWIMAPRYVHGLVPRTHQCSSYDKKRLWHAGKDVEVGVVSGTQDEAKAEE